jgi:hypothetical protein
MGFLKQLRPLLVAAFAVALVVVAPAAAAQPVNDTFGGAVTIGALPFTTTLDTTEATTDADDVEANADCDAPATDASVWYAFTPTSTLDVFVDASASSYAAGLLVVTGAPGSFTLVECDAFALAFSATANQTYYVLAFDFENGTGGTLDLSVFEFVPPEASSITVEPVASVEQRPGIVTVTGTATCSNADEAFVFVDVSQPVGRFTITGFGDTDIVCDGTPQSWSVDVAGSNGRFGGGKATATVELLACTPVECAFEETTQQLQLKRRK